MVESLTLSIMPARALLALVQARVIEVAHRVKEDRRGVAERIDAVEHAAVTGDDAAEILDAEIAFDGAHHRAAAEARHRDKERDHQGLGDRKRREKTNR